MYNLKDVQKVSPCKSKRTKKHAPVIKKYSTAHYQSHFVTWTMKLSCILEIVGYQQPMLLMIHIIIQYKVSSNCPFDYCLLHPSYLNLSTLDLQCRFNRSGVLCGQCQHGLSAVFGSSRCKHCSNMYGVVNMF